MDVQEKYRNPSEIKDDLGGTNAFLSIYFQKSDKKEVLIRKRTTVLNVLQETGGFASIAFFILYIVAYPFAVKGLDNHLSKSF